MLEFSFDHVVSLWYHYIIGLGTRTGPALDLPVEDHLTAETCDGNPAASAHPEAGVNPIGGLHDRLGDAVTDPDRHPAVGPVPVHLEPLGIPGVHSVGGHELVIRAIRGSGEAAHGGEADVGLADGGNGEGPADIGGGHLCFLGTSSLYQGDPGSHEASASRQEQQDRAQAVSLDAQGAPTCSVSSCWRCPVLAVFQTVRGDLFPGQHPQHR